MCLLKAGLHTVLSSSAVCCKVRQLCHSSFQCYHKRPTISVMEVNRMFLAQMCVSVQYVGVCACAWVCFNVRGKDRDRRVYMCVCEELDAPFCKPIRYLICVNRAGYCFFSLIH